MNANRTFFFNITLHLSTLSKIYFIKGPFIIYTSGGHQREIKKSIYKKFTQPVKVFKIFFTQPLIEIQDFKAAFVNLTRNDCFICFCHCDFHVYVIKCIPLLAIIIHCNMFSFSHWSFFFTQPFRCFKNQLPTQFLFGAPLRYK